MKKFFTLAVIICFGFLVHTKFVEAAYAVGFVKFYKEATLENSSKQTVKCNTWAFGVFDEMSLMEKYESCINDYQKDGYAIIKQSGT
ncbi:hypothetical protein [Pseudoalteromonas luteoviolacea]|uniref:Uncharacterized protein n=1 Tax=Pseudoalteromonas luteoviolacea S4054 TaxID=1129367 RepID=A0A0F6A8U8_9GAMM|nr:hypothetical protein [Pseudoalteromonas luteoviolacea]AOT08739.1 hypothetical protein S4054249_13135 [Pseudoalteromonas luteoviolacea]AOT13654.1 hypothetical protein S40542_13110 [Pseudoalteromonas luteoviolacea]AOT18567.1 hypothetical protein S4054_13110 [Pseudoalteromonas luteoviolacea]KKE82563.1 hypothetical protein N479_17825 [Pseudoalteromonas luteoviolacea S4054]KZN64221.1 hypothetical protein N481_25470 [Pseudoalteromonas luteoviolacea S4047-1]